MDFPEIWSDTTIFLKGQPRIRSAQTQQGVMGDTVHIECDVTSIPRPEKITWVHNGRVINMGEFTKIYLGAKKHFTQRFVPENPAA